EKHAFHRSSLPRSATEEAPVVREPDRRLLQKSVLYCFTGCEREGRFLVFFVWRPPAGRRRREFVERRARVIRLPSLLGLAGERRLPAWAPFAAPGPGRDRFESFAGRRRFHGNQPHKYTRMPSDGNDESPAPAAVRWIEVTEEEAGQ